MKELGRRSQALGELAGLLDIIGPEGPDGLSASLETKNRRKNREVSWRSRLPVKPLGFGEELVELVIPPSANTIQLLRFMGQLDRTLHDDSYGSIMSTANSWSCGVVITVMIQSTQLSSLVIKLANLAEVEKVEEEPLAESDYSGFPNKFGGLLVLSVSPSKRINISLAETEMARQELSAVLN